MVSVTHDSSCSCFNPNLRVVLKSPFSPNHSIQSSAKSYQLILQFLAQMIIFSNLCWPATISLTRLPLKPFNWLPYFHSCSAKVRAHTTAKVIFICLKAMLLSYLSVASHCTYTKTHTSHCSSYIPPWYGSCPLPYPCLKPSPPCSLAFLCLEQPSSNHLPFYSLCWSVLFPDSLHISLILFPSFPTLL